MMTLKKKEIIDEIDWQEVAHLLDESGLYLRDVQQLENAFRHSTFCWFGYEEGRLIAVARAISDLTWSSYLADVAVSPPCQGKGYGLQIMQAVQDDLLPYGKILIYSVPDKIGFYQRVGFEVLATGMVSAREETLQSMRAKGYIG